MACTVLFYRRVICYFKTLTGAARVPHRETCNREMGTNVMGKAGLNEIRFNSTVAEPSAGSHDLITVTRL